MPVLIEGQSYKITNIVFINQVTGYLMKDLINTFVGHFSTVALIAGTVSDTGRKLHPGVKMQKIVKYNKKNRISRLISWFWALVQTVFLVNTKFRNYHLFITSNPPTLAFLSLFCKNKYSVLVYDVYPDGLVASGFVSNNSIVNKIWQKHNKRFFSNAVNIFTPTNEMAGTLSAYIDIKRINVVPLWSLFNSEHKVDIGSNNFIRTNNLQNYFIVLYSGNIGLGHNVSSLVEIANVLKEEKDIKFIIIGEGWNKKSVETLIQDYKLENCLVLPFQPTKLFLHALSAADIAVVSVASEISKVCAPSKTYNLINFGIPILAIAEPSSGLAHLINDNRIGGAFKYNQTNEAARFIQFVKANKEQMEVFKKNLKQCAQCYTSENAKDYLKYLNIT